MSKDAFTTTRRQTIAMVAGAALTPLGFHASASAQDEAAPLRVGRDQSFDLGWRFLKGEGAFEGVNVDDSAWRTVDLPHDWSIEDLGEETGARRVGPFDAASPGGTATAFTFGGEGWYRKRFQVTAAPAVAEIIFDGVYTIADVWLNGERLGENVHGYVPFRFDLSPHLRGDSENVLAVRVRNLGKNSRWYSGSGIYRPVRLDVFAAQARIDRWGVHAWTRRVQGGRAEVEVKTTVLNWAPGSRLRSRLVDNNGVIAAEAVSSARNEVEQTLRVEDAKLWSPSRPQLYTLETTLLGGEEVVDHLTQSFGVRIVVFDPTSGMSINGEPVTLRGGCVHHDNGLLGAAAFTDADERRVLRHKARGFNAIRSSHNPCSRSFREACDRHGMLLIEEAFDMWHLAKNPQDYSNHFAEHWRDDLGAMVLSARNSPSVIMWSIGNEVPGRASREGNEYAWRLANEVHRLDPTRPVTAAIHGFNGRPAVANARSAPRGRAGKADGVSVLYLDVPGYNYRLTDFEPDHQQHPWRPAYGSETYARDAYDYVQLIARAPCVLGEFVWTSMDYLGEAGIGAARRAAAPRNAASPQVLPMMPAAYPWVVANCGDIDLIGQQKPQSLYRDVVWGVSAIEICVQRPLAAGQIEQISLWGWSDELPSWTWPDAEQRSVAVRVYTLGDRVDLSLNGVVLDSKALTPANKARADFDVSYAAGVLEAVAYKNGAEIGRKRLETVGAPARLRVDAENQAASAGRGGLSFVNVSVVDEQGRILPDTSVPVRLRMSGPADLAAFGSANPHAVGSFQSHTAQTFRGRALAILRSKGVGAVRVEVSSDGLEAGAVNIGLA